jgi:hypothetical protein
MSDLPDDANKVLTDEAPTGPVGLPDGHQIDPVEGHVRGQTSLPDAHTGPPGRPVPESGPNPTLLALTGEPNSLPPTWCKKCQAEVLPYGKGKCPRCHTFLKHNFVQRKHPVNVLRRDALLKKLVADYQPQTTLTHASCEHLAGILEQLETMKPGSPDHQRLVQLSQTLGASLEESRRSREAPPEVMTIRRIIVRPPDIERDEDVSAKAIEDAAQPTPVHSEPVCEFCHQTLARCAEIKSTRPDIWPTLHARDPEELKRRDKEATAEMFEALKRQRHGDPNIR